MNSPKFLFAGGGTGGHLFPGIAVADELIKRFSSADITFLGSTRSVEKKILDHSGYSHYALKSKSSAEIYRHPISFVSNNWKAYKECYSWIQQNQPDVVVGLGGFSSVPVVSAAYRLKVPVVLLEQNTIPGRANRLLNSFSSAVCTSFDVSENHFSKNTRIEQTGNPVREKILKLSSAKQNSENLNSRKNGIRTLLILGGSQGAMAVNQMVMDSSLLLKKELAGWKIIHQTGMHDYDRVKEFYSQQEMNVTVAPFFEEMSDCYLQADLVISRAGATSLAELSALGLPSILIPYPKSIGDHQLYNAWYYSDEGASKIVEQEENFDVSTSSLVGQLRPLLKMENLRDKLSQNMLKLARNQATLDVVKIVLDVAQLPTREYEHPHHVHYLKRKSKVESTKQSS